MKFSIITPNYKSGKKLKAAHFSLHDNQCAFEHIIIDDFSEDDSLENLINYQGSKNIVPIWLTENAGPGNARNQGLSIAKGDYVIFLDSDDTLETGALDLIAAQIEKHNSLDLVLFDYVLIKQRRIYLGDGSGRIDKLSNDALMREFMVDNIVSSPWCKCIKTTVAKRFEFPSLSVQEDSLYNFSVFQSCNSVIKINRFLYNFDKSFTGSLTTKPFTKVEMLKFYKSWLAFEKMVKNSVIQDKDRLLAIRKIKFCCFYYINRLVDEKELIPDPFILGVIKKTLVENIGKVSPNFSLKSKLILILFIISPRVSISIIKLIR